MRKRTVRGAVALTLALVLAIAVGACGSSANSTSGSGSAGAQALLTDTFSGSHAIKSGVLGFNLSVNPSGSSSIKGPITLSLTGPFQSRGAGKLPLSNLSIDINALGHHGQLGLVSTGSAGYITLKGAAYQLPSAEFEKLASSFTGGAGGSTGGLAKFGIKPLHWLTAPTIVGSDSVAGAPTTHIRAKLNVSALLSDVSTFLGKAAASGATGTAALPTSLSPATRQRIAAEIRNPTVDIWTGATDKTLRKLAVGLTIPVSGSASTLLGGLTSATIQFALQYSQLNQPQSVATPTNVKPFSEFQQQVQGIVGTIEGLGGASGSSGAGTSTSGSAGGANPAGVQKYSQCIQRAGGDVTKMQKCAPLLTSG
ncbi:MAG TPA: hypothetical protein VFN55_17680 [Solirubrobacteraceae bacterium]|nr:hypothetical protein [Solirubrobacteraceae bacterium]